MASRSRFYVDTPRDPSQRHSMFVSHSELAQKQDLSSNSSSATLPSAAGSVDRLTGLEEKKSPRFFTLKPKTSFSLKPFFTSSSSLISLSPAKRRKAARRDSYVQTEESRPEFGEVGVQTLNASTVDVPVQTCLEAWEEGDSYGQRRLAYASARASPFWSRPYGGSSAVSNSLISKNVLKDPLASPKLVKYAAPGDSQKTGFHRQSAVSPLDVNSCQSLSPPPQNCLSNPPASVPVKYFSAKELISNSVSSTANPESGSVEASSASSNVESYENVKPSSPNLGTNVKTEELNSDSNVKKGEVNSDTIVKTAEENSDTNVKKGEQNLCQSESSVLLGITPLDNASKVSNDLKDIIIPHVEPISVLKHEITDSPSRRPKSVHFNLPNLESVKQPLIEPNKPRNVDKDFEALLRDLNVLTDDGHSESDLQISLDIAPPEKGPTPTLLSPTLKSALDCLRLDFLAPIPESSPIPENDQLGENSESKSPDSKVKQIDSGTSPFEIVNESPPPLQPKKLLVRSVSEYENQDSNEEDKDDSVKQTSPAVFTCANSGSNAETDSLVVNVYDNVIKEKSPVKTLPLPILPSFFETPSQPQTAEISEIVEDVNENNSGSLSDHQKKPDMPLETDFDRSRLSRSSSRSSVRSNSKTGLDTIQETMSRFDSCENLDQLEEEIIRSLYTPDAEKLEESIMKNIELPPSETFQNSGTTATHMRRVILDQLLSGKSVEDIVPNYKMYQQTEPGFEKAGKYKPGKKYKAVLTKMEDDNCDKKLAQHNTPEIKPVSSLNISERLQDADVPNQMEKVKICHTKNSVPRAETPKKTSVFLFPDDNLSNNNSSPNSALDFSTTVQQNRGSSVLEVRRSSWTPQPSVHSSASSSPSSVNTVQNSSWSKEKSPDNKSGQCDFTNCLRPSKMQNSPFLAKLNTRSMSPCSFSPMPPIQNSSPVSNSSTKKKSGSSPKPLEAVGECDYASCLKPSQVQNSLFTAELSEITAGKSTNSLRTGSPLTIRMSSSPLPARSGSVDLPSTTPLIVENDSNSHMNKSSLPARSGSLDLPSTIPLTIENDSSSSMNKSSFPARSGSVDLPSTTSVIVENDSSFRINGSSLSAASGNVDMQSAIPLTVENDSSNQDGTSEPVSHKSELLITLQTSSNHSNNEETKAEASQNTDTSEITDSATSQVEQKTNQPSTDSIVDQTVPISIVPPPPPPPPPPVLSQVPKYTEHLKESTSETYSEESVIPEQKSNIVTLEISSEPKNSTPQTSVMAELEIKLQTQNKNNSSRRNSDDKVDNQCSGNTTGQDETSNVDRIENNVNGSSNISNGNKFQNGNIGILSEPRENNSALSNGKSDSNVHGTTLTFSPNTVITDEPPPPGAVLLDKKITVDGDKVHTDKFYAIPVKEVLKEKTSTTKFIPAPPKYEGIGPTEDGIPIGLRNSVKKENMHNWYKTMFKSLHKADSPNDSQEYIIGYTSEPESSKKDIIMRKKSSTLDNRTRYDMNSNFRQNGPPSAKSSIEVYNVRPRLIEDYEPGYSSVTDDQVTTSRRYLPSLNTPKPSYEFKNGYESDTTVTRKRDQPEGLTADQQKMWYREVQKGGEIPRFGLGKPAPEKPKEPFVGPVPPPPLNYVQPSYQQATRPLTLPPDYSNQNGNGYCQQMNGIYEMQMRHAIHSEMQQRMSPSSNQLSPPNRTMVKSPSRSPDMKIPARALFDFKAESPKEIPLKKGDMVLILRQLDKNWYEGEHNGIVGIFPISYVEIVPPEHASTPVKPKAEGLGKALYDFVAQTSIELTVRKGDAIQLIRRVDANWFEGIFNNKKGIIPISYVQVLQDPPERSVGSPSPRSYVSSPSLHSPENKIQKTNSISPLAYSPNSTSPLPVSNERKRIPSKKGSNLIEPAMYRAMYSYSPQNTDELELQEGDSVYVVEMCDDGWYVGTSVRTGVFGIFPGNYVEKVG